MADVQSIVQDAVPLKTIARGSAICLEAFKCSIRAIDEQQDHRLVKRLRLYIEDELERFMMWSSNMGVFAVANESLDFRLREVHDVAELFLDQLEILSCRLQQLQEQATENRLAWDDSKLWAHSAPNPPRRSTPGQMGKLVVELPEEHLPESDDPASKQPDALVEDGSDDWETTDLVDAMHESIEWLHRLARMVRRASLLSQNKRAAKFKWRDLEGNKLDEVTKKMKDDLKQIYAAYLGALVDDTTASEPAKDTPSGRLQGWAALKQRLIETMVIRHIRILYRRDKASKSPSYALEKVLPPSMEEAESSPAAVEPPQQEQAPMPIPTIPVEPGTHRAAPTEQSGAPTLDKVLLRQEVRRAPSRQLSAGPSSGLTLHEDIPSAPRKAQRGSSFVCSYCCCILSAQEGCGTAWRKHIERDLDAYICVFEPCDSALELYSSKQEWLAHMWSRHRTHWVCFSLDHKKPHEFPDADACEKHMRESHAKVFRPDQIPTIVKASEAPMHPLLEQCPFCSEPQGALEDHVAHHLRTFALRSLPCPDAEFGSLASSENTPETDSETEHPVVRQTIADSLREKWSPPWHPDDDQPMPRQSNQDAEIPDVKGSAVQSLAHYLRLGFGRTPDISHVTLQRLVFESPVPESKCPAMDAISQSGAKRLASLARAVVPPQARATYERRARAGRHWVLLLLVLRVRLKLLRVARHRIQRPTSRVRAPEEQGSPDSDELRQPSESGQTPLSNQQRPSQPGLLHPALMKADWDRKTGSYRYRQWDHSNSGWISVGGASFGGADIDCKFLFKKSQWGYLGGDRPAGIIYLDLDVHSSNDCSLVWAKVEVTLEDADKGTSDATVSQSEIPVQITDFGPRHMVGEARVRSTDKVLNFQPQVDVFGVGGVGSSSKSLTQVSHRWEFSGRLVRHNPTTSRSVGDTHYKTLVWVLSDDLEPVQSGTFHTAFAFEHSGQPFHMGVKVHGELRKISHRLKESFKNLRFGPRHPQRKDVSTTFVGAYHGPRKPLDELARGLALAMEYENYQSRLVEVPKPVPEPVFGGST